MRIVRNELNMQLLVHKLQFRPIPRLLMYVCHQVRSLSLLSFETTERTIGKVSKPSTNRAESKLLTSHTKTQHIKVLNEPEECWWMEKSQGSVKKKRKGESKGNKRKVMDKRTKVSLRNLTWNYILNYAFHFMQGHYPDLLS